MVNIVTNQSVVFEFILIGFPGLQEKFHVPVSISMFLIYVLSLFANSTVITLIILKRSLHQPMYIVIANLSLSDLLFDTITLPKIICKYWFGADSITFYACVLQLFFVHYLGSLDSLFLMLMAIDRYVAICKPLRYHSIISNQLVILICFLFWLLDSSQVMVIAILASKIFYCGPNKIKNVFCSNVYLSSLACGDHSFVTKLGLIFALVVLLIPLAIIILSYILIIRMIHLSDNNGKWQKAFYTCSTHLVIIGLYYIPRVFIYITSLSPVSISSEVSVVILCLYTYIPHLASPIVYCLRTRDIRHLLGQAFQKIFP
ncbi:hypothetical protein GDO86_019665 [Hymenochirus boettgeri]|uniref:Olfactory receptor n=1 Tax=Hymenochirus boettgeri TaxID=247094 RepID=A0A8T2IJ90_9PIPI|nr:hypothetical protein GDO86_019665 [Hymenochirus boettgeri]